MYYTRIRLLKLALLVLFLTMPILYYTREDGHSDNYSVNNLVMKTDIQELANQRLKDMNIQLNRQKHNRDSTGLIININARGALSGTTYGVGHIINQAIIEANIKGGGIVYIPPGIYMIDAVHNPVRLKSNVSVILAENAVLKALPNDRTAYNVIYFSSEVNNSSLIGGTIEGERYQHVIAESSEDINQSSNLYVGDDPKFIKYRNRPHLGEWGYGINIDGASAIVLQNVKIINCWGDGICVRGTPPSVADTIVVKAVSSYNNRRQGMSIISARNVWVVDGEYSNTNGTAPQAGIDLEPNSITQYLKNINIINVSTQKNKGAGIQVTLHNLGIHAHENVSANPVSILIANYSSRTDKFGLYFANGKEPNTPIYGNIDICNVNISRPKIDRIAFSRWSAEFSPQINIQP